MSKRTKAAHLGLNRTELVIFTRQLATLLTANVTISRSLECLQEGFPAGGQREMISEICSKVSSGFTLSKSMGQFPATFDQVYVALVKVGESSGSLAETLSCLSDWKEKERDTLYKVKSALGYPSFLLLTTLGLTVFFVTELLPKFSALLSNHKELPLITRVVMGSADLLVNPLFWLATLMVLGETFLIYRRVKHRPESRRAWTENLLRLPLLGPMMRDVSALRFCATMSATLSAGLSLISALGLAGKVTGNIVFETAIEEVIGDIRDGSSLKHALFSRPKVFQVNLRQLLAAAEETGNLKVAFDALQVSIQESLDLRLAALEAALGPAILAGAALVVGTIVVAIFLPLYGSLGNL